APSPGADNVVALIELFQQARNVFRLVLQIAIHGDYVLAGGVVEAGSESAGLPEIAPQSEDDYALIDRRNFAEQPECRIAASVIDKDQLEWRLGILHHRRQARVERHHVVLLVVQRHYNRVGHYLRLSLDESDNWGRS